MHFRVSGACDLGLVVMEFYGCQTGMFGCEEACIQVCFKASEVEAEVGGFDVLFYGGGGHGSDIKAGKIGEGFVYTAFSHRG